MEGFLQTEKVERYKVEVDRKWNVKNKPLKRQRNQNEK